MARPKKPLDAQRGNLSTKYKESRRLAEKSIEESSRDQLDEIPRDLSNYDAVWAWNNWVAYLRDKNFYGNVNIPELIGYCNAWAVNVAAWREVKAGDDGKDVLRKVKESSEEMTRCMNRGGFSVNARLQYAEAALKTEMEEINSEFGI